MVRPRSLSGYNQFSSPLGYRVYETRTAAVLEKWYSLVREKRATRMDFIRTVTKAFDVDSTKLFARQEDVDFIRFTVENFSAFEYKTQEEVLAVIRSATNVLSVAGMQLMEVLSPSDLMRSMGTASLTTTIEEVRQLLHSSVDLHHICRTTLQCSSPSLQALEVCHRLPIV